MSRRDYLRVTLQALVFIAFRFYAIYFFAQLLPGIPIAVMFFQQMGSGAPQQMDPGSLQWAPLFVLFVWFLAAVILWFAAGPLARNVAREFNPPLQCDITLEGAYSFAFVFLGLFFALSSIATTSIALFKLIDTSSQYPPGSGMQTRAGIDFYRPGITFVAGLASIFGARKWARLLAVRKAPKG